MNDFTIPKSTDNPLINFNYQQAILKIEGNWFTEIEIGREITDKLIAYLAGYFKNPKEKTIVNIKLSLFSTSYSKLLLEIFKYLESQYNKGYLIEINWFYQSDDEDFLETGDDFNAVLKIPINLCEY